MTILPRKVEDWPESWFVLFSERAGIKEFCANMSRGEAEHQAEKEIRALAELEDSPESGQSPLWEEMT
jgi:hypothetical protein